MKGARIRELRTVYMALYPSGPSGKRQGNVEVADSSSLDKRYRLTVGITGKLISFAAITVIVIGRHNAKSFIYLPLPWNKIYPIRVLTAFAAAFSDLNPNSLRSDTNCPKVDWWLTQAAPSSCNWTKMIRLPFLTPSRKYSRPYERRTRPSRVKLLRSFSGRPKLSFGTA